MNRDRVRSTPLGTWTGGQSAGGTVDVGRFFPMFGGIALPVGGGSGASIKRVLLDEGGIKSDHVEGHELLSDSDSVTTGGIIYIAKPFPLRNSLFNGQINADWAYIYTGDFTRTRTSTSLLTGYRIGAKLNETITPGPYQAGEQLYIGQTLNKTEEIGGPRYDWIDLNVIARRWEAILTEVQVCEDGEARWILVRGGPTYL